MRIKKWHEGWNTNDDFLAISWATIRIANAHHSQTLAITTTLQVDTTDSWIHLLIASQYYRLVEYFYFCKIDFQKDLLSRSFKKSSNILIVFPYTKKAWIEKNLCKAISYKRENQNPMDYPVLSESSLLFYFVLKNYCVTTAITYYQPLSSYNKKAWTSYT